MTLLRLNLLVYMIVAWRTVFWFLEPIFRMTIRLLHEWSEAR